MAKYKAYPEYKDSGVEWLKAIPEHWKLSKLRYQFFFGKGLTITKEHLQDEGIPCVNYGEVHSKYGFEVDPEIHTLKCVSDKYLKNNSSSLLAKGDIIFADTSEDIDGSGNFTQLVSDTVTFAGYHTIIARPFERENSRFYAYLLDCKELRSQVRHAVKGVKVFSITQAILRNLSIWLPSNDEQAKIAAFLDHETAKIDNLIKKQQQLIELLKEKRQSVISHAVTKGLNPDVSMKDSGVEWLGEVPEHWELVPLKYLCNFSGGGTPTKDNLSYWQGGSIPWVSPKDMKSFWISETQDYVTPKAVKESSTNYVEEGSLLMVVRSGILQRNIPVAINIVKVTMNQDMKALRFNERMKAHYAAYFINGNVNSLLLEWTKEGATVESIEHEYLANRLIPVPPIDEQHSIIKSISDEMKRFESLEEKALTGIRLLQERRTALISAAVTGKIDVRDWVAPNAQDVEESQEATA
ncbi:restriction endonuclease subunit S [Leclercia adecarboxylata]|uniref:restriction endonuclease subunit S n=1 Tax=Leclercia adecarboxylata TaxID=83655 RepID=UPI00124D8B0A|nr:restriction endonuclease subunit S [Leclercia adecarboxylata]QFH48169.1 restriction endonuclease subunit S [Leclercia adecarboxylata]